MAERVAAYMQAVGLGAQDDRLALESQWGVGAEGVITPDSFQLTSGGGTTAMSVTVSGGRGIVHSDAAFGGSYHVISDSNKAIDLGASSGSQYRRDAIVARIRDASLVAADGDSSFTLEPIAGAFSLSNNPPLPAIPDRAILVGDVLINPNATSPSKINDARKMVKAREFSLQHTLVRTFQANADIDDWKQIHGVGLETALVLPSWIYRGKVRCEHHVVVTGTATAASEVEFRTLVGNTWDDPKAVGNPHHYFVSSPGSFRFEAYGEYDSMPTLESMVSQLQVRRVGSRITCLRFDSQRCWGTHSMRFIEKPY